MTRAQPAFICCCGRCAARELDSVHSVGAVCVLRLQYSFNVYIMIMELFLSAFQQGVVTLCMSQRRS